MHLETAAGGQEKEEKEEREEIIWRGAAGACLLALFAGFDFSFSKMWSDCCLDARPLMVGRFLRISLSRRSRARPKLCVDAGCAVCCCGRGWARCWVGEGEGSSENEQRERAARKVAVVDGS